MNPNPTVLYISYDGMTDPLGQSQVLPYLAGLSDRGYKITLLSCEKEENFASRKKKIREITRLHKINWVPVPYTKKPPVLSTLWDIRKLRKKAFALHRQQPFAIVHCRSYISALVGLKMKERFGCKFIFDMRGFWADERVDGNLWRLDNPLYKTIYTYFKGKEREFLEEADYTISLTENAKGEIHSWPQVRNNPVNIEVIPCCVDTGLFSRAGLDSAQLESLRKSLGLTGEEYVLSYLGAIGTWYMLEEMLDFYRRLLLKIPGAKFLFITAEDPAVIFEKAAAKGITGECLLVRRAERAEVPLYIALSDCAIFFIKPAYSKKASSPTKQGELMSMGLPVICNAGVGDTDRVVERYNSGMLIHEFDDVHYDEAVQQVAQLASLQPGDIRKGALDFYSLEEGIRRYAGVYAKVMGEA
jgi:glycosyltransferase involved in cell wall biosynthesis